MKLTDEESLIEIRLKVDLGLLRQIARLASLTGVSLEEEVVSALSMHVQCSTRMRPGEEKTILQRTKSGRPRVKERTRLWILKVTREIIDREGVNSLTVEAIADEAGVAVATIYNHFTSRQELLLAALLDE